MAEFEYMRGEKKISPHFITKCGDVKFTIKINL